MRVASALGLCAGYVVLAGRFIMPTRLLRYSAASLAIAVAANYAELYGVAATLSFLGLVFAVSDIVIDEFVKRVKDDGL